MTIPQARAYWYIACASHELKSRPLAVKLFGTPLVLFRDALGQAAALLDRCAHRNVPLSTGRLCEGQLECAYHGWRYDTAGICRRVPALLATHEGKARRVPAHAAQDSQGYVWVYGEPDTPPLRPPFLFPHNDARDYHIVRFSMPFAASLVATLENILDVPHTAFLHRGLFRSGKARRRITAIVRRGADRVEAQYVGEKVPRGVVGALLAPRGGEVEHTDRFILPSVAQVEYGLHHSRIVITDVLTPVDDFVTHLHSQVCLRLPMGSGMVARLVTPLARHIARQDATMLQQQSATVQRFGGEQFVSTEIDVLGGHIVRLLHQAERQEFGEVQATEERIALEV